MRMRALLHFHCLHVSRFYLPVLSCFASCFASCLVCSLRRPHSGCRRCFRRCCCRRCSSCCDLLPISDRRLRRRYHSQHCSASSSPLRPFFYLLSFSSRLRRSQSS